MTYTNTSKVSLRRIDSTVGKEWITQHHYSHRAGPTTNALGIIYDTGKSHNFFDEPETQLIGVMTYGHPVGFRVIKSISELLENHEVLELTRLHIADGYGTNIESHVQVVTKTCARSKSIGIVC